MVLRQIHTEDMFGPSLGGVWRSRWTGTKNGIFRPYRRPSLSVTRWLWRTVNIIFAHCNSVYCACL